MRKALFLTTRPQNAVVVKGTHKYSVLISFRSLSDEKFLMPMGLSRLFGKLRFRITPFSERWRFRHPGYCEKFTSNEDPSIKEGYIWKQSKSTPLKRRWKKRYFVLSGDKLYFLKEKSEESVSVKIIRILDIVSLMAEDFGFRRKKFGLRLRANNKESLIVSCSSEAERNDWLTAVLTAKSYSLVELK